MNKIQVEENALPQALFDKLQQVVTDVHFPWRICRTADEDDNYFSFNYYSVGHNNTPTYELAENCAIILIDKYLKGAWKVKRIRFGLIHRDIEQVVNNAHIDNEEEHLGILLYLNSTDGNTIFYNEFYEGEEIPKKNEELTIQQEVTPVENRAVFFEGYNYHSSQTPTETQLRFTLNINLERPSNGTL